MYAKAGEDLAAGFWGVVCRGDLELMAKHFGLANVTSVRPCSPCQVTNTLDDVLLDGREQYPLVARALLVRPECARGFVERFAWLV